MPSHACARRSTASSSAACKATSRSRPRCWRTQVQSGDFNTGFIAEHYAHGFSAADVPHADPGFLVALAVCLNKFYRNRARALGQFWEGSQRPPRSGFTVCTLGQAGDNQYVETTLDEGAPGEASRVTVHAAGGERTYELALQHTWARPA
jgi:propionyl-CoA carboxylase alpha chain